MDDIRDDFEEEMEEDEVDALDDHDMLLGLDDDGLPLEDEEDEEKSRLDNFFQRDDEVEESSGF